MRHILVIILAFTLCGTVLRAERPSLQVPETGESPDAIRNVSETFQRLRIHSAPHTLTDGARRSFLFRYCPLLRESRLFSPRLQLWIPKARNGYVS